MKTVHRFSLIVAVLIATLLAVVAPTGCTSVPEAFTKTATPVASSVIGDMRLYADRIDDETAKSARLSQIVAFEASVQTGSVAASTTNWASLKEWLLESIRTDASISDTLRTVRTNDAMALDYIISTANKSAAAAK